eukprot:scaffold296901_cov15-Tisochrysis_lutea.AAC.1
MIGRKWAEKGGQQLYRGGKVDLEGTGPCHLCEQGCLRDPTWLLQNARDPLACCLKDSRNVPVGVHGAISEESNCHVLICTRPQHKQQSKPQGKQCLRDVYGHDPGGLSDGNPCNHARIIRFLAHLPVMHCWSLLTVKCKLQSVHLSSAPLPAVLDCSPGCSSSN